jgi:glycerophosphoryl diester phosphodiesterase
VIASGRGGLRRVGHKGADAIVPGNTVASFERAVEIGVEMIEFDVLRTPEGDPSVPAAQRAPLLIAHDWHDAASRRPHTLAEALEAFTRPPLDAVEIDCDLKLPGREDELVAALREHDLVGRAMVSTMYVESLVALRELEPALRRGWTYPKVTRPWDRKPMAKPAVLAALAMMRARLPRLVGRGAKAVDAAAVWVYHPIVTRALARRTRQLGIELIAWTVDEPSRIAELREIGVDGICSNDPRLLATGPQDGYPAVPHGFR